MSTTIASLISRASRKANDPNNNRTKRDEWLEYYNETHREVAAETRVLETDATFSIQAGVDRYTYPPDAVAIKGVAYTITPSDEKSFADLFELFRDEFRAKTSGGYPTGHVWAYYARSKWFHLVGQPDTTYAAGGRVTYWYVPPIATVEGDVMHLPDFLDTFVLDGMVILNRLTTRERVAARQDQQEWQRKLSELRDKMEDRSDDRRPAFRPPGGSNPFAGQT